MSLQAQVVGNAILIEYIDSIGSLEPEYNISFVFQTPYIAAPQITHHTSRVQPPAVLLAHALIDEVRRSRPINHVEMSLGWGIRVSSKSLQRSANPSSASSPLRSKAISGHSLSWAPTSLRLILYKRPTARPNSSQLGRRCALAAAAFASIGLGYLGYDIYSHRNPPEQREPDPTKKTLVILGMHRQFLPQQRGVENIC